jgi:uncharacterized RDD family membrane protein YckC
MAETARPKAQNASILIRLIAGGYDLMILLSIGMVGVGLPITLSAEVFGAKPPQWVQYTLFMAIAYAYFVGFWFKDSSTTGMRPWRLRLAMVNTGDRISLTAATVRFFGLMVTWLAMAMTLFYLFGHFTNHPLFMVAAALPALSLLCILFTSRHQALHDLISGTGIYQIEK